MMMVIEYWFVIVFWWSFCFELLLVVIGWLMVDLLCCLDWFGIFSCLFACWLLCFVRLWLVIVIYGFCFALVCAWFWFGFMFWCLLVAVCFTWFAYLLGFGLFDWFELSRLNCYFSLLCLVGFDFGCLFLLGSLFGFYFDYV